MRGVGSERKGKKSGGCLVKDGEREAEGEGGGMK